MACVQWTINDFILSKEAQRLLRNDKREELMVQYALGCVKLIDPKSIKAYYLTGKRTHITLSGHFQNMCQVRKWARGRYVIQKETETDLIRTVGFFLTNDYFTLTEIVNLKKRDRDNAAKDFEQIIIEILNEENKSNME